MAQANVRKAMKINEAKTRQRNAKLASMRRGTEGSKQRRLIRTGLGLKRV